MTSKSVPSIRIVPGKPGERTKIVRKRTYMAKNKKLAADREAKAWERKGKK